MTSGMKKILISFLTLLIIIFAASCSDAPKFSEADAIIKDGATDFVITRSDVDDGSGKETALSLRKQLAELKSEPDSSGYEIVCLKSGQKLLASEPCEMILRSGSAIIVSITTNGVNDLSDGNELMNTAAAPLYHSLLVPRGDGRGIQITSGEAYVMVRGGHQIVD